jgi:hypothetical protein
MYKITPRAIKRKRTKKLFFENFLLNNYTIRVMDVYERVKADADRPHVLEAVSFLVGMLDKYA